MTRQTASLSSQRSCRKPCIPSRYVSDDIHFLKHILMFMILPHLGTEHTSLLVAGTRSWVDSGALTSELNSWLVSQCHRNSLGRSNLAISGGFSQV